MIATRSLIPLLAMIFSSALTPWARFPEIVVNAVGCKEPAKRHFDFVANRDLVGLAIGHLAQEAAAAVEVCYDVNSRRIKRIGEAIDSVGGDFRGAVGELIRLHEAGLMGFQAAQWGWELGSAAVGASRADEAELPFLGAHHRRSRRAVGIGTARRLSRQNLAPLEIVGVGHVALGLDHAAD